MASTLYILYNADGTFMGKLKYGYRKLRTSTPEQPACAACDITHGGLSFTEIPSWVEAKKKIEGEGLLVKQLHRNELSQELKTFIETEKLKFPTTIMETEGVFKEVLNGNQLKECCGDSNMFVTKLYEQGILKEGAKLS